MIRLSALLLLANLALAAGFLGLLPKGGPRGGSGHTIRGLRKSAVYLSSKSSPPRDRVPRDVPPLPQQVIQREEKALTAEENRDKDNEVKRHNIILVAQDSRQTMIGKIGPRSFKISASPNKQLLAFSLFTAVLMGGLALGVGKLLGISPLQAAVFNPFTVGLGGLLSLPLFACDALLSKLQREDTATEFYILQLLGAKTAPPVVAAIILLMTVATGLGEETLFRGLVQQIADCDERGHILLVGQNDQEASAFVIAAKILSLCQGLTTFTGPWIAVLGSSLLFGLAHKLGPSDFGFIAFCGLVMGLGYQLTGNLAVAVAIHTTYDFLILVSAYARGKKRLA